MRKMKNSSIAIPAIYNWEAVQCTREASAKSFAEIRYLYRADRPTRLWQFATMVHNDPGHSFSYYYERIFGHTQVGRRSNSIGLLSNREGLTSYSTRTGWCSGPRY